MYSSILLLSAFSAGALAATTSASSEPAPSSTHAVNSSFRDQAILFGAIQAANYRKDGSKRSDVVSVAQNAITEFVVQPPIQNLIVQALEYYQQHAEDQAQIDVPAFVKAAVAKVDDATSELAKQSNYSSLISLAKNALASYDASEAIGDAHDLLAANPRGLVSAFHAFNSDSAGHEALLSISSAAYGIAHELDLDLTPVEKLFKEFNLII